MVSTRASIASRGKKTNRGLSVGVGSIAQQDLGDVDTIHLGSDVQSRVTVL